MILVYLLLAALLLFENIFDLRELRVRDIMRPREAARALRAAEPIATTAP